ncbi:hypothetical protein Thi970DRAFT_03455 [Thiorhodovibrio frisius]|uniref:BREX system P-loop protein BrxC n=2 Tax=Thiorhodovibrio frisius TaxID=631362 RepID=H8Z7D4_9GAMM|nr:hypothetical protein Thi970DRAFT_03455 [Thiorhodovibrio frisius]WPL20578.1 hypothetical protein Thiofri_00677 [Thiorhodovibrio frisius]
MNNRDIFSKDPLANRLINNGVAEVSEDRSQAALEILRYELDTFVCDGEYAKGLQKILETFLGNLGSAPEQPSVWISGFYGSGKSHLAKMLRAFWVDVAFDDGATARSVARLPTEIKDHLRELNTQSKRYGGLHAASGKLGSGAGNNVRLALLGIVFKSAGLPEKYNQARLMIWLKREGILEAVEAALAQSGTSLERELPELFVSDDLHAALLAAKPELAPDAMHVGDRLIAQYPEAQDVTNDEMINAVKDALTNDDGFPLTLIILDEVQQFIGDSGDRAYSIQEVVESCSKHFGGRLLFVGTGQTAMSGTPSLQKIKGRFTVPVQLSDTDVEAVIRKIILQKQQGAVPAIQKTLTDNLGEISRHLRGTKLEHTTEDEHIMVADYPLLPVRRRFWEKVLHKLDESGTISQLRNQLRIVHEAACATAEQPLGQVVSGDFIYDQLSTDLLQTGLLSREVYDRIGKLAAGDDDARLKSSLLKLIYLVSKLPTDPMADIGLRATEDSLADLLVTDLSGGSSTLRKRIPALLDELHNKDGLVMAIATPAGTEYRLQTAESSAWHDEYRKQVAELSANTQRLEMERIDLFKTAYREALKGVHLTQGQTKEARTLTPCYDDSLPADADKQIVAWFRDDWSSSEAEIKGDARNAGPTSPSIFVFLPAQRRNELRSAIIEHKAAQLTLETRGIPATPEGQDARSAMETRRNDAARRIAQIVKTIIGGAQVFQGGGQSIDGNDLTDKLQIAGGASVVRLYRDFDTADQLGWDKVIERARKGETQPLQPIKHSADTDQHPVCAAILKELGASKKGSDLRDYFKAPPYGWPQDAVDGALYALVASGHVLALNALGKPVDAKELERRQITQSTFKPETVTISPVQKIQIRKVFQEAGVSCQPGTEIERAPELLRVLRELAAKAGGEPPKPEIPDQTLIDNLEALTGNALLAELFSQRNALIKNSQDWATTGEQIAKRWPVWTLLQDLLDHAKDLGPYQELEAEAAEIRKQRALLADHDPVQALLDKTVDLLRTSLNHHVEAHRATYQAELAAMEQDSNWQTLMAEQCQPILAKHGLHETVSVEVATPERILDELDRCALSQWSDRTQALKGRFEQARLEAAKLLEPKVQRVDLPRRTLRDEAELAEWLAEAEGRIRNKLNDGPVML